MAKGAAWAVPAVTIAGAAPSLAASGEVRQVVLWGGCYQQTNLGSPPYFIIHSEGFDLGAQSTFTLSSSVLAYVGVRASVELTVGDLAQGTTRTITVNTTMPSGYSRNVWIQGPATHPFNETSVALTSGAIRDVNGAEVMVVGSSVSELLYSSGRWVVDRKCN